MIKLTASYEEREEVKQLGARWSKDKKCWYIPEKLDFHPFKKWISSDEYEKLEQAAAPLPLHDFFAASVSSVVGVILNHSAPITQQSYCVYDILKKDRKIIENPHYEQGIFPIKSRTP